MKYKVVVEDGFAGNSQEYNGKLELTQNKTESILEGMNKGGDKNQDFRDDFNYVIEIANNNEVYRRKFEEGNIPRSIPEFMVKVNQNDRNLAE